jgi:hypothetical protein
LIYGISFGIGVGTATNTAQYSGMYRRDQTPIGYAAIGIITMLVGLAFTIWNWGYRRSRTGATIGQSTLKLKKSRTPAEKLRAVGNIGTGRLVLLALALGVASVATLFLIRTTIYDQQVCYAGTCYEEGWP